MQPFKLVKLRTAYTTGRRVATDSLKSEGYHVMPFVYDWSIIEVQHVLSVAVSYISIQTCSIKLGSGICVFSVGKIAWMFPDDYTT